MRSMTPRRVVISTSRKPSQRTRSLCKELGILLPDAGYVQRGKQSFAKLLDACREIEARSLLLVGERNGNPGKLDFYLVNDAEGSAISFEIKGVRLAREFGLSVRAPSGGLIFSADDSQISRDLGSQLGAYLSTRSPSNSENSVRILSITDTKLGNLKISFEDSQSRRELGPSITGSWKK